MKKVAVLLAIAMMFCVPAVARADYSAAWYEPSSSTPIVGVEVYISGGTFTGPLSNFTNSNNNSGPSLVGWSSFVAGNYPQTAVVAAGSSANPVGFYVNFTEPADTIATISFYPMIDSSRTVIDAEAWTFVNGNYVQQVAVGPLPSTAPSAVPVPPSALLLIPGCLALLGARKHHDRKQIS
jgi:hypothetical protein